MNPPQPQPQTLEAVQRWLSRTHGIAESDTRQVVEVVGAFAIATYRQQEADRAPQVPQAPPQVVTMAEVKAYVDGRLAGVHGQEQPS